MGRSFSGIRAASVFDLPARHQDRGVFSSPRRMGTGYWVVVGLVALAGVADRWLDYARVGVTNSDEALSGLMARELWHGHAWLFLWGQDFGGTLEVFPVAVVTKIFGQELLAERAVTIILGAVVAYLGWRIADRLSGPVAALVAAAMLWLWPLAFVDWSMHEYLYYEPVLALGLGALWWALRSLESPEARRWPIAVGVAGGLAFWLSPQVIVFVPSVVITLLWAGEGRVRRLVGAAFGAVVGAAPWLWFNLSHGFSSLDPGVLNQHQSYATRLHALIHSGGPVALGLEGFNQLWVGSWAHALYPALVAVAAFGVVRALVIWYRRGGAPPVDVLGILACPFLIALSPALGTKVWAPRYFFFAWPFLAFALARVLAVYDHAPRRHSRSPSPLGRALLAARRAPLRVRASSSARVAAVAVGLLVIALGVAAVVQASRLTRVQAPAIGALTDALAEHGDTRVFSSYWQAYLIDQASDGIVIATPSVSSVARYKPWDREVRASPDPAWVFVAGSSKEAAFRTWLPQHRLSAQLFAVVGFDVYRPDRKVLPEQLPTSVLISPTGTV